MRVKIFFLLLTFLLIALATFSALRNKTQLSTPLPVKEFSTQEYLDLHTQYESLVAETDPRQAIIQLETDAASNQKITTFCHDFLHTIGHAAYHKYGSFEEALTYSSDYCNSGYIHGVLEEYFEQTENPLENLAGLCSSYAQGRREFDLWQCHHGVGHGFMYLTKGDLDESLRLCEEYLTGTASNDCFNGVYMEVFNNEVLADEAKFVDPHNPFATCDTRGQSKASCYLYAPTYFVQHLQYSFAEIILECEKVASDHQPSCNYGIGSEAIKRNMNSAREVFALCQKMSDSENQESCIRGIVALYMNQKGSAESGREVCLLAPQHYQAYCNEIADFRAPMYE